MLLKKNIFYSRFISFGTSLANTKAFSGRLAPVTGENNIDINVKQKLTEIITRSKETEEIKNRNFV